MSVKVPLLDLQAQYRPLRDEILAAITRVSDSQRFVMGPEIAALEGELARMLTSATPSLSPPEPTRCCWR
jgi:dTDP-4-amino-4,6-dideoxygalactose transaminase